MISELALYVRTVSATVGMLGISCGWSVAEQGGSPGFIVF